MDSYPDHCKDLNTSLWVRANTTANTTACTAAAVRREAPGGRYTMTPGVNTKNNTAAYTEIPNISFIILCGEFSVAM
jgi:hypothetical protein